MLEEALSSVVAGNHLGREQAAGVLREIMEGRATPAQIGGLLVALRMNGETVDEITGFAETMRAFATRISTKRSPLVDTCGTGGDQSGSFNISTAVAFVAAGAGVAVAKHGNRSASSQCGSADVLEELGVNVEASPEQVGTCIDEVGIGFLFARTLHSAMGHVAAPRRELRMRTVFNVLGPLTNPAGADRQLMGVFDVGLVDPLAQVLQNLGAVHALVVAGSDGLDELTLDGPSVVAEAVDGSVSIYELDAKDLGLEAAPKAALAGGDAKQNAAILWAVLEGEQGPRRDVVLLNAAAALRAAGKAPVWKDGLAIAAESIDSGAARKTLESLIKVSNDS